MKVHQTSDGKLVAACDEDVLGKEFTEGEKQLIVAESFYKGEKVDLLAVLDELEGAHTTNFVGNELNDELVDSEIVQPDEVDHIDGMAHSQL
ncbi:MAG: DUF424 family protein, partial [Candidatus Nanohaloarchaea archaeon]|nr:DUF424 family protein [Candidatus Nanohaloarchaea archaeon]